MSHFNLLSGCVHVVVCLSDFQAHLASVAISFTAATLSCTARARESSACRAPPSKRSNCTSIPASQLLPPPPANSVGLSASQPAKAFTRGPNDDFAIETLSCCADSSEANALQIGARLDGLLLEFFERSRGQISFR